MDLKTRILDFEERSKADTREQLEKFKDSEFRRIQYDADEYGKKAKLEVEDKYRELFADFDTKRNLLLAEEFRKFKSKINEYEDQIRVKQAFLTNTEKLIKPAKEDPAFFLETTRRMIKRLGDFQEELKTKYEISGDESLQYIYFGVDRFTRLFQDSKSRLRQAEERDLESKRFTGRIELLHKHFVQITREKMNEVETLIDDGKYDEAFMKLMGVNELLDVIEKIEKHIPGWESVLDSAARTNPEFGYGAYEDLVERLISEKAAGVSDQTVLRGLRIDAYLKMKEFIDKIGENIKKWEEERIRREKAEC